MSQYIYITHFNGGRPFAVHVETPASEGCNPLHVEAMKLTAFKVGEYTKPCFEIHGDIANTFHVWVGEDSKTHAPVGHEILVSVHKHMEVFVNGEKLAYNEEFGTYGNTYFIIGANISRFRLGDLCAKQFITQRGPNDVPYSWIVAQCITYLTTENICIPHCLRDTRFDPYAQYYGHCKYFRPLEKDFCIPQIGSLNGFEGTIHKMLLEEIKKVPTKHEVVIQP